MAAVIRSRTKAPPSVGGGTRGRRKGDTKSWLLADSDTGLLSFLAAADMGSVQRLMAYLQTSAGNTAVQRLVADANRAPATIAERIAAGHGAPRLPAESGPAGTTQVQRCGPSACGCSPEERAEHAAAAGTSGMKDEIGPLAVQMLPSVAPDPLLVRPAGRAENLWAQRQGKGVGEGRAAIHDHIAAVTGIHLQRKKVGTKVTHGTATSTFTKVDATFDGQSFVVKADGAEIMNVPAESGRPNTVRAKDATNCGSAATDSYLNNPLYVGIKDRGPIPEGTYKFKVEQMMTFSETEQQSILGLKSFPKTFEVLKSGAARRPANLLTTFAPASSELPSLASSGTLGTHGSFTDPFGSSMHGGDWGDGRVVLRPVKIEPGPCGSTSSRSGFYLHGGVLPGSSGCIDIGDKFIDLSNLMLGFKGDVNVRVSYAHVAPTVNTATRDLGKIIYPDTGS